MDRAFIQFAGFTAGFTESFFSFGGAYSSVASSSRAWDWLPRLASTAQVGNGVSGTISLEESTARRIGAPTGFTANPTSTGSAGIYGGSIYGGAYTPDIVANVRVDQAWGSAQIMGALHEVRVSDALTGPAGGRKWGYAVGGGFEIKTPQTGNPNNSFLLQGTWTKGAIEFTGLSQSPVTTASAIGWNVGVPSAISFLSDAWGPNLGGAGTCTGAELTKAWSAYGAYRHYWTPMLRTGFAVGYTDIDQPGNVNLGNGALGGYGISDVKLWQGFVSTIWSPVAGLDLSLDVVYSKVKHSCSSLIGPGAACLTYLGATTAPFPGSGTTNGAGAGNSEDIWTVWTRIRRNF
jgi:hypothetical protein